MIDEGLKHLTERFSVDRTQWRQHFKGGDQLLDGLLSHGYAWEQGGRYAVTQAGRARLFDAESLSDG